MPILGSLAGASTRGFGFGSGSADLVYIDEGALIPISSHYVHTDGTASVTFSNIPSTYATLVIRGNFISSAGNNPIMRFNGDTGSNYFWQHLWGDGAGASINTNNASTDNILIHFSPTGSLSGSITTYIGNYASTSKYKNALTYSAGATDTTHSESAFNTGVWLNSSSAITSITILPNAGTLKAHTKFNLYGLKAAS